MEKTRELYGFVISSKRRHNTLKELSKEALRPIELSKKTKYEPANISRTLFQLEKNKLVECITPNKKTWRVYAITELGRQVLKYKIELTQTSQNPST